MIYKTQKMHRILKKLLLAVVFLPFALSAQNTLDEAKELYKIGAYKQALPVFEREYLAKPADASLNFWYGVCLYETGTDLKKAEECIALAGSKNVQEALLYLGKIYSETYRFEKAEKEFQKYAKAKRRDKDALARLEIEEDRLDMLQKAAMNTENVQIIDSIVIDKQNLLSAYKLSPGSGYLTTYNTFFQSGSVTDIVYSNEKETKVYYSRPTENALNSLFSMEKLIDGFGNEKKLSVNDFGLSGNLNYPFVLTDGVTIYFAAEDEDGMGGYDIYVTRYNMNSDTYLTPQRLNMPFNSPFNDYMMVIDEEKGVGWFATDRFQPEGKVCIYTFIPNESVENVDSDDEAYLAKRAAITSIKDSWQKGADYSKLITISRTVMERKADETGDFYFIVNDRYIYTKWADFKNSLARDTYKQANEAQKEYIETANRLNSLRNAFAENPTGINRNEIVSLESKQAALYGKINELEIKTRSLEVPALK